MSSPNPFRAPPEAREPAACARGTGMPRELDLRGVPCPLNWVRARLALEKLAPGAELVVRLDPGEPLESVPRSAREDGHEVSLEGERVRIARR